MIRLTDAGGADEYLQHLWGVHSKLRRYAEVCFECYIPVMAPCGKAIHILSMEMAPEKIEHARHVLVSLLSPKSVYTKLCPFPNK